MAAGTLQGVIWAELNALPSLGLAGVRCRHGHELLLPLILSLVCSTRRSLLRLHASFGSLESQLIVRGNCGHGVANLVRVL